MEWNPERALWALGILFTLGLMLNGLALYIPFGMALSFMRLKVSPTHIVLKSVDAEAMVNGAWILLILCCGAVALFPSPSEWSFAFAFALWLGFRIEFQLNSQQVLVQRSLLGIPWSQRRIQGQAHLYVSGWGDEMDPEALHLAMNETEIGWELAWTDASSTERARELVEEGNTALSQLYKGAVGSTEGIKKPHR